MSLHPFRRVLLAAVCVIAFAAAAAAEPAALPDPDAIIPVGPQVKDGTLPNGLRYYIHRNGKPARRLELRLVVKAGSVLEDEDQQGLAHFAEHMAFNGTTHFEKHELVNYLQSIGTSFGADLNAYTSFDETVYILPVPSERKEYVEQAFAILQDWAHGIRFDPADIDKERAIVLEEARVRKGAGERIAMATMPRLLPGTRYGERFPIGKEETLRTFTPAQLTRFYRDWYRPDLMAMVVVGDIDPAQAERQILSHFSALKNPDPERPRNYQEVRPLAASEAMVVVDKEASTNVVSLNYPLRPAPDRTSYRSYREIVVDRVLGSLMAQRLAELAQLPDPPFVGAGAGVNRPTARHKGYVASATLGAGGSARAIKLLLEEQQRVREYGFGDDELERVRKVMISGMQRAYAERDTTDSWFYADEYVRNFLTGEEIGGREAELKLLKEILGGLQVEEINAYARTLMAPDVARLVLYTGRDKAGETVPTGAQLLAEVAAAEQGKVAPRAARSLPGKLMERPLTPGRIVAESEDKALGLTRLTLSNGVRVVLKPTSFRQDQVVLRAERFGSQYLFEPADLVNARLAGSVVASMGVKGFSQLDLPKVLAGRQASVGLDLNSYTDTVHGASGSSMEDVEAMLQLLWLRFDGVRRDEEVFKSGFAKQTELLRDRLALPEARFDDALADTLYGKHPYTVRALRYEDLAQVDLDRIIGLYRQRFASARGLTFVLVGNLDMARLRPLLEAYLGTLPTGELPLHYRDVGLRFARGPIKREVRAGTDPKSIVTLNFTGPANWSPDEQLRMEALLEVVNLKIVDVLREKLGLLYGGGMSGAFYRVPVQQFWVQATLPTAPDKVEAMTAAFYAELEKIRREGPEPADLAKVKSNWHQAWPRTLQSNGYWADVLVSSALFGTDAGTLLVSDARAEAITVEAVRDAARRYLDPANCVQLVRVPDTPQ